MAVPWGFGVCYETTRYGDIIAFCIKKVKLKIFMACVKLFSVNFL